MRQLVHLHGAEIIIPIQLSEMPRRWIFRERTKDFRCNSMRRRLAYSRALAMYRGPDLNPEWLR